MLFDQVVTHDDANAELSEKAMSLKVLQDTARVGDLASERQMLDSKGVTALA